MMRRFGNPLFCFLLLALVLAAGSTFAQADNAWVIKKGRVYVQLPRQISAPALDSFVHQFDLADVGLFGFLRSNRTDSLRTAGWRVDRNNEIGIVISKPFEPFTEKGSLIAADFLKGLPKDLDPFHDRAPIFSAVNAGVLVGANRFRNKASFYRGDSLVRFFLRGHLAAQQVMLAGSFNNWSPTQLPMQKTDSGWIREVKLGAGKWWYKFIADGDWMVDKDNALAENDGQGNVNSVFYRPNVQLLLPGYAGAKNVHVAGSFNGWKRKDLAMTRTAADGWELWLYLAQGTHTYKYLVDGNWVTDGRNPNRLPDGHGDSNSVIRLGKPQVFALKGFANAKEVMLIGSFNQWRESELRMEKTADGWRLPYTLGPGNHAYKFKVDGKWITDPANALGSPSGNSFLIIEPNHSFRLRGFDSAKTVYLAGDFNDWDPAAFAMRRVGDEWVFDVHLFAGKQRYKFVVDGKWVLDPANKLWEQNEYGTGNSVLWVEQ